MDRYGFAVLLAAAAAVAFFTLPKLVELVGHPMFVLALSAIVGATVALAIPVAAARSDGTALPLHGRGVAALALLAVGASVAVVGHIVVRPRTTTPAFKEQSEQALFDRAFSTGNLAALAGCWRTGPWSNASGFRELCFSGRSSVTFAVDTRFHDGTVQQCVPWPGANFVGVDRGALRIEAPQTGPTACVTNLGRRGLPRNGIDCRPIPGIRHQLDCTHNFAVWDSPGQINNRAQFRYTRTTAPRPALPTIPQPAPPPSASRPIAPPPSSQTVRPSPLNDSRGAENRLRDAWSR